jgi:hypothetical protein
MSRMSEVSPWGFKIFISGKGPLSARGTPLTPPRSKSGVFTAQNATAESGLAHGVDIYIALRPAVHQKTTPPATRARVFTARDVMPE